MSTQADLTDAIFQGRVNLFLLGTLLLKEDCKQLIFKDMFCSEFIAVLPFDGHSNQPKPKVIAV